MNIVNLVLKNFRNYESLEMNFSPNFNFLLGENGAGKSNILEAISIIAQLKSFKGIDDREIVR